MVSCVYCGERVDEKEFCCTSCGRAIPAYLNHESFSNPVKPSKR